MPADGALLVRPDQHVALRARGTVSHAPSLLLAALDVTYGAART